MDAVEGTEKLSTLLKAVKSAGLVDELKGKGPFTIFAPNDEAFKKIPGGELDKLLEPGNVEKLKALIMRHVVTKKTLIGASFPKGEYNLETAGKDKEKLTVISKDNKVTIKSSKVNAAADVKRKYSDIAANNGVVHIIDKVLI